MSSAINDIILNLFDQSAEGIKVLLPHLKTLFNCDEIFIASKSNKNNAANEDDFITLDDETPQSEYLEYDSLAFKTFSDNANKLALRIDKEELILYFEQANALERCTRSMTISSLIPHIQQAVLIAQQISRQQCDQAAVNYVVEHHPLRIPGKPPSKLLLHESQKTKLMATFLSAANQNINIAFDKTMLIAIFNLTQSEAELAKSLFDGLSLQETAETRNVSKQTIRKQLQSVLKKTNCDSQEKLILAMFEAIVTRLNKNPTSYSGLSER